MKQAVKIILSITFLFIASLTVWKYTSSPTLLFLFVFGTLFVAYLIWRLACAARVIRLIRALKLKYGDNCQIMRPLYVYFALFPKYAEITYGNNDDRFIMIFVGKGEARFHFDTENSVEIYVGTRESYKTGKNRYAVGRRVNWKLKGRVDFPDHEGMSTTFIFSKAPLDVTSSDKSANSFLGQGDTFFGRCKVYTLSAFINSLKG